MFIEHLEHPVAQKICFDEIACAGTDQTAPSWKTGNLKTPEITESRFTLNVTTI
jgi:hypothetical protein